MAKVLIVASSMEELITYFPIDTLLESMHEKRHTLSLALSSLSSAARHPLPDEVTVFQMPFNNQSQDQRIPVSSYYDVLHNAGLHNSEELVAILQAWQTHYGLIKPETIIFLNNPVAMLAAIDLDVIKIRVGNGFNLPDNLSQFSQLQSLQGKPLTDDQLAERQNTLQTLVNKAASIAGLRADATLQSWLFESNTLCFTEPELDHFSRNSDNVKYVGLAQSGMRINLAWLQDTAIKIYVETHDFDTLAPLLAQLHHSKIGVLVYGVNLSEGKKKRLSSDYIRFIDAPLSRESMAAAHVVVTSSAKVAQYAVLNATPVLAVPVFPEAHLLFRQLQEQGVLLNCPLRKPEAMLKKLQHLLSQGEYRKRAQALAQIINTRENPDSVSVLANYLAP